VVMQLSSDEHWITLYSCECPAGHRVGKGSWLVLTDRFLHRGVLFKDGAWNLGPIFFVVSVLMCPHVVGLLLTVELQLLCIVLEADTLLGERTRETSALKLLILHR